ncbi:hypothetical protein EA457_03160 [Streptococcus dysgalactiae subsp. dysgalactiae]|uniref:Uncharacterized protein n=1 Tax=Streptococcus dysgalactiae subsp. dysgalactiae TaxID=99822 RepID=A0A9X7S0Q4_STRDY|nr:hypothetical protein [Streptococcus dysgalactiae subsp. dysgalactiae]QGG97575.1 hypothetical protein EA459_02265 [Streptococcus dysgalactiae subsp. dysgalactiae]QGH01618.1 hypothetical protein EA457_03160 [Streptococcus dysgalactiae subsp. dysgalactiae]QGH03477.1 hypothetical protein EA458_02490 [Streptococcus dysgalactiae subsp. dysgalactiae]
MTTTSTADKGILSAVFLMGSLEVDKEKSILKPTLVPKICYNVSNKDERKRDSICKSILLILR